VIVDVITLKALPLELKAILNMTGENKLQTDVLKIGISKIGTCIFLAAFLACLLYGLFMNPQTSLDEMTRWCFIIGGAVLTIGTICFMMFPPSALGAHLDAEGFNLTGEKIPWEDVLRINKHEFRMKKNARFFINVHLRDSSPFKPKKGAGKKLGEAVTGKSDISFEVQFFHDINGAVLLDEMLTRWRRKTGAKAPTPKKIEISIGDHETE
jgi:hypothetical protein